jgi:hypothetical protein
MSDLSSNPYQAAEEQSPPAAVTPEFETYRAPYPHTLRVTGALMIASGILNALYSLREHGHGFVGGVIDLLIGISLLRGNSRYVIWAIIRVVLGAIFVSGVAAAQGDVASGAGVLFLSLGFLLLLVGKAGRARAGIGAAIVGMTLVLAAIGLTVG